jgi:murein DD-endopeptidase MepM/ murein hydrolase activator NlpD
MMLSIENIIRKYHHDFHPVVPFDPKKQRLAPIDLTSTNETLTSEIFNDTDAFCEYIDKLRKSSRANYLIGGYNELRAVYGRSELFNKNLTTGATVPVALEIDDTQEYPEPRRLHLGTDIWGDEGTSIFAPFGGMIHSFAFNNHFGDYGATLIIVHQLDGFPFYTLYGHLSLRDIANISAGQYVNRGQVIAHFGPSHENGHWPPHLHFQIILDMELYEGDYPGVCRYSERDKFLTNCPDPDMILRMNRFLK